MNILLTLFIIAIILFIVGSVIIYEVFGRNAGEWVMFVYFMWFIASVIMFPTSVFEFITHDGYKTQEQHEWYLESLSNSSETEGSFFLGIGSFNEVEYYYSYVNTIHGYTKISIPVHSTYLVETDNRRPEYVKIIDHYNDEDSFWKVLGDAELRNILYVPKGTIVRKFSVN